MKITDAQIKELFLAKGFKLNEGGLDLRPYVYEAARDLIALAQEVPPLFWRDRAGYHDAFAPNSLYRVAPTDGKFSLIFITGDAAVSKVVAYGLWSVEEAETFADEHNRKRIVSQLKYGGD